MDATRWRLFLEAVRIWLPVVISVCAISLTIYQAAANRRHQRLSVQPRLELNVAVSRDGGFVYTLVNHGFGPGILREVGFTLDGAPIGPDGPATCARLDAALGRGAPDWETSCFDKEGDFIIPAGDEVTVYGSRWSKEAAPADPPTAPVEYLRVRMTGTYCSFYEDCFTLE
jgi:hypothetical protein